MTKLLQQGIDAVKALPPDRQDVAGEVLLGIAQGARKGYQLNQKQIADLKESIAEADRGEFVSDKEMVAVWKDFGL